MTAALALVDESYQLAPLPTAATATAAFPAGARPLATVTVLRPPAAESLAPGLRLTRRGVVALAALVAATGAALVWWAALSTPGPATATTPATVGSASTVVRDGDTLWAIAGRVAPDRDPRAEVDELMAVNHLDTPAVQPGQVLHLR